MRAPTPVRALVHRSTLVTAGVFLFFIFFSKSFFFLLFLLFIFGILSIIFSSLLSLFELDLKKIVALSTLSQMGLCFLSFSIGFYLLSFFHLLRHAFFKRLLFLQVGFFMFLSSGQQNLNFFFYQGNFFWVKFQILLSLLNLCGIFFFNGLIRKHIIVDFLFSSFLGFFLFFFFCLGFFLTIFYSFKFFTFFFFH
jgi:NADH-ubiquinone oxidoreductase chain 5